MPLIYEHDVFSDAEHGVRVMGIDDGGYAILMRDVAEQLVDQDGCLRVESGVWLVAEEIFRVEGYRPWR